MSAKLLLRAAAIRAIERRAATRGGEALMARAGQAIARLATSLARGHPGPVVVVAGPGNNGGDAWVAADILREGSIAVSLLDCSATEPREPLARAARARYLGSGGDRCQAIPARASLVLDGLFGLGLARDLDDRTHAIVSAMNECGAPVLAIDVPSGVDADTGTRRRAAVRASHTITFIADKPGLHTADGPDHTGTIHVDPLGIPADWLLEGAGALLGEETVASLPPRPRNSHKGTFGTVAVVGGAAGMAGAAVLAARGALFAGAGKVYATVLAPGVPAYDPVAPEVLLLPLEEALVADVLVAGPGAGAPGSPFSRESLPRILATDKPLVLDADALTALADLRGEPGADLRQRRAPTVLTPHPGEAARLLHVTTAEVQADRLTAALRLAEQFGCTVVLKGAGSVCADATGRWAVNGSGNPGLASGGTGDVLAGVLGALLAQGLSPWDALCLGVWAHGEAADRLVTAGAGPTGLTAGELPPAIRGVLNGHPTPSTHTRDKR